VLDDFRVLNEDGLRYEDEFVKHKILDAIGICICSATASSVNSAATNPARAQQQAAALTAGGHLGLEEVVFERYADAPISYIEAPALHPPGLRTYRGLHTHGDCGELRAAARICGSSSCTA